MSAVPRILSNYHTMGRKTKIKILYAHLGAFREMTFCFEFAFFFVAFCFWRMMELETEPEGNKKKTFSFINMTPTPRNTKTHASLWRDSTSSRRNLTCFFNDEIDFNWDMMSQDGEQQGGMTTKKIFGKACLEKWEKLLLIRKKWRTLKQCIVAVE